MKWLREAVSDGDGLADMAYISIGLLTLAAIASLTFIFTMSTVSYSHCQPTTTVAKGAEDVTHVQPCVFDPLPVGQSAGLIFGAFGALIGALAGYMAATRKQPRAGPPQTINAPNADTINQNAGERPAAATGDSYVEGLIALRPKAHGRAAKSGGKGRR